MSCHAAPVRISTTSAAALAMPRRRATHKGPVAAGCLIEVTEPPGPLPDRPPHRRSRSRADQAADRGGDRHRGRAPERPRARRRPARRAAQARADAPRPASATSVTTTAAPTRAAGREDGDRGDSGSVAPGGERERRRPGRLQRARQPLLRQAQLVAGVGRERVPRRSAPPRRGAPARTEPAALVDPGELPQLPRPGRAQLAASRSHVRLLGVALRADRHVLAGRHRQRAGGQPGDPGGTTPRRTRRTRRRRAPGSRSRRSRRWRRGRPPAASWTGG